MNRAALAGLVVAAALAGGCAVQPDLQTRPVSATFPTGLVPPRLDGLEVRAEPSATAAFARAGHTSAVARGAVWTLRDEGTVVGSVQVSQLKGGLTTRDDRVRQGIRAAINNGSYRWFKLLDRQWVGVQEQPNLRIYLWMPPRSDVYVVLQLKSTVALPEETLAHLIAYEEKHSGIYQETHGAD